MLEARRVSRLVAVTLCALGCSGGVAIADEERGIDPAQGQSLVEVEVADRGAALRLQREAEGLGVTFNDHYLRTNRSGSVTASVFATEDGLQRLADAGYELGRTVEGPDTWRERLRDTRAAARDESRADGAATSDVTSTTDQEEVVILRADFFENTDGRFLSVEAKDRLGTARPTGNVYEGPTLSLSFNRGDGTPIDATPRVMSVNIDTDTNPDTYIEHRLLVRIGEPGSTEPATPTRIRVGSSTSAASEADVEPWLDGGLPPMGQRYLRDFTTRYMDPSEVYSRIELLADEFPNIAELVPLPFATNGYQRKAQANMAGTTGTGSSVTGTAQTGAVVLTSRAWGHEGGNDVTAEFVNPGIANAPLAVTTTGNDIRVSLATSGAGALVSTAAQVVEAVNADAAASRLVVARTYRGNAGAGTVVPRAKTNLSDFLRAPAHVPRGPFEYSALRIGKKRDGKKVGVFLYCQQHAREWATPLTCLETAEQLLRNYAVDGRTKELVNNLDIFILPSSNPDGAHYSMYDFSQQRRNLTNHCVVGGHEADDADAASFWTPRANPQNGAPYTNTDAASRNAWGVDLNRNNAFGTLFDGYIGASHSCTSDVYAGPGEASEPEIRNELWVVDTFKNIKFSNNIHSFGGYFMWSPGTYLGDRSEGAAAHPNIGIEKYFFEAGDRILNRIKEVRNTAILPERTGPIADVLYSAAGNSADEHWYHRGIISYSFETGADRFVHPTLSVAAAAGADRIRASNRTGFAPGDTIRIEPGTANEETATVAAVISPNPASPNGNVVLTAPLERDHAVGAILRGGVLQTGVGFQPDYATEGRFEALEFAAGNFGLLESAFAYGEDTTPPQVEMTGPKTSKTPITTTFRFVNEPSVIHYTTDGSAPTTSSPAWDSTGPREAGQTFEITQSTTFRWLAKDIKGNTSAGRQQFVIKE